MDSAFPPQEQIQEQRRALAEDTVSYAIYLRPDSQSPPNESHDSNSSVLVAKTLINSIVKEIAGNYIWHKDAFSLRLQKEKGSVPAYLRGETRFGDCLDDEWLVVHILREITKRIPGSIARVQDNDGEFLLIEAADHIPSWLDPDNSENRVFLYEGNLHIIPIATTQEGKKTFPTMLGTKSQAPKLQDALDLIWQQVIIEDPSSKGAFPIPTRATARIQQSAFAPLTVEVSSEEYAAFKMREQKHYARCQIPITIARLLKERPELVTRASEAFYTRDTAAMAVCSRMEKFLPAAVGITSAPPSPVRRLGRNSTEFVTTAVCFTRTCYAQLMGQQFRPPKSWDGIVPSLIPEEANDPEKAKEAELGMKLTCGFEILCSPSYPKDFGFEEGQKIQMEDFPFATDGGWHIFKRSLVARQYFGDERPGSKRYQELEHRAQEQYLENKSDQLLQQEESLDEDDGQPAMFSVSFYGHGYHPVQEIERILAHTKNQSTNDVATLVDNRKGDDDSWMDVDLQVLEDMMRARGFGGASMDTESGSKSGLDMQQMLDRFGEFIQEGQGGIEGAEFLDERSDEDESDEDERDHSQSDEAALANEPEGSDEDEDIFASDYEEKQARKQAAKRAATSGAFVFESDGTEVNAKPSQRAGFELNPGQFKDILTKTFGVPSSAQSGTKPVPARVLESDEDEDEEMDDGDLKEYMAELDAELSGTKIGQSFEKTTASRSTKSLSDDSNARSDKGKGKVVDGDRQFSKSAKPAKPEKNLEDLLKKFTDRSRRGPSRQGPLPMAGGSYGYDPASMAFADDEDEDEDENEDDGDMAVNSGARISAISPEDELGDEIDDDDDVEEVVDIDMNLAKNLLESFKSQGGLPGPGGNLLSRLGIVLPRDDEDADNQDDESE
ncbi:hypothetical protein EMPS_00487 [Entomortierella parvispora]|uniref:Uncharacterized protein n=1 Tax=Entomortierella parvispora TaxID=205924 RepID=A0A9P3LRM4_9FUNG|nr:hypothetical protein EMPS_00487 [Entomortierella parvispora]